MVKDMLVKKCVDWRQYGKMDIWKGGRELRRECWVRGG